MKKTYSLLTAILLFAAGLTAQDHFVTASGFSFTPQNLTINLGETVQWDNSSGIHNVNGSQATYPGNPEGFFSGSPANAPWSFSHTFNTPGVYNYQCDQHVGLGMTGTITVMGGGGASDLVLTAVFDGPLTGGLPKGIEIYVINDIPDLSIYGVGSANNGQGTDGEEFTFPAVAATAGDYLYITQDSAGFADYFGFNADYPDPAGNSVNINGDDAIELFMNGSVVDIFGDINVDGTGTAWEYMDGWAYRVNGTGPDGSTFVQNNWLYSGIDVLDNSTTNGNASLPIPIGTYSTTPGQDLNANDDNVTTDINEAVTFDVTGNDFLPNGMGTVTILEDVANGMTSSDGSGEITYTPSTDFCGSDQLVYEICDNTIPSCDTATVHITVNCPVDYPAYNIDVVTTVDANGAPDSLGRTCQLQGIVYGVDLQPNNPVQFTLIDATGGIALFSNNNFGYTVEEGDEVIVQGTISTFNCLTQITPDTLWEVSQGNALVDPLVIDVPLDESHESELIRINGVEILDPSQWNNQTPGFNVVIEAGNGTTYELRIDADTDIFGSDPPEGVFDVIGIGGQFDNSGPCDQGYQFLPRYREDFIGVVLDADEVSLGQHIRLAPNPTDGFVNWSTELTIDRVDLFDLLGRPLRSIDHPQPQLDLSELPAGVYLLRFQAEGASWTTQVIRR